MMAEGKGLLQNLMQLSIMQAAFLTAESAEITEMRRNIDSGLAITPRVPFACESSAIWTRYG
jgi:hypothetical protein